MVRKVNSRKWNNMDRGREKDDFNLLKYIQKTKFAIRYIMKYAVF